MPNGRISRFYQFAALVIRAAIGYMKRMNDRAPLPCPEMETIRRAIDALDKKLVSLLAERQKLIEAAGKVKPSRDTVRDEARIEEVVALVKKEAAKAGLAEEIAEPVWRQLIESSIAYEYGVFDER